MAGTATEDLLTFALECEVALPHPAGFTGVVIIRACLTPEVEGPGVEARIGAGTAAACFPLMYCCMMSLTHGEMPALGCKMEGSTIAIMTSRLSGAMSSTGPRSISTADDMDTGHSATWGMVKDAISASSM